MEKSDKDLIHECIILPSAISMLIKDYQEEQGDYRGFTLAVIKAVSKGVHDHLVVDYKANKRELYQRGYVIITGQEGAYRVRRRGAEEIVTYTPEMVKRETIAIIERYVTRIVSEIEQHA